MFDFTGTESNPGFENGFDMGGTMNGMSADFGMTDTVDMGLGGAHNVSFGCTGDASFDSLIDEVDKFNAETRQLTELARQEIAANDIGSSVDSSSYGGYTYDTGDAHLDNLLNEVQQCTAEYGALADQARMELGPGKYLSIDDAINQGGSQGLADFIQQRLDWMDHATPEQLRQFEHQIDWQHEVDVARTHEHEVLQEYGDLLKQFAKHQTKEQFDAEKAGYHQVNPWSPYRLYTGDPDIFEKDGELYRLIPGTGGTMERL